MSLQSGQGWWRGGPTGKRAAAVLAALLLVAGCSNGNGNGSGGSSDTPGVTDSEILVGTHQPLTGPAAAGYTTIAPATKAYFD
jgi:hypothetical protein